MRLVGTTQQLAVVEKLSKLLSEGGIPFTVDSEENLDWGSLSYGTITWTFWVLEEKDFPEAMLLFRDLVNSPHPQQQEPPLVPTPPAPTKPIFRPAWGTRLFCCLCIVLFFLDAMYRYSPNEQKNHLTHSPIEESLFFDVPHVEKGTKAFYFPGYLPLIEATKGQIEEARQFLGNVTTLQRIREGEVWRLITPAFLHHDLFHLMFNMFWLLILGRPLERLLGTGRFILFSLMAAMISNIAQYCISGPLFLGFSAVIAAYAGYIFSSVRSYYVTSLLPFYEAARFLFWVILFFTLLSFIEIGLVMTLRYTLPISVANTAHLVGFLFGYLFGRMYRRPRD